MLIIIILILSVIFQLAAASLALMLISVTGRKYSWILISIALCLMSVRRIIPLFQHIIFNSDYAISLIPELIGFILSVLMFFGIIGIRSIFIKNKENEDAIVLLNTGLEKLVIERTNDLEKAIAEVKNANMAKSVFLANMSHEIRTPLNAVLGFSQLMQNDENLTAEQIKWLNIINKSGEHLLSLINDVLEISKIEAGRITFNRSIFDIHSMLIDITNIFRVKTDMKKISFILDSHQDLPKYISTDEGKLRQILTNLIGNAIKFTNEGGVALRAKLENKENNKATLIIEVEDTGPGIQINEKEKLFKMFSQTNEGIKEGGTGLGLAISQQYAKIMNGEITVRSEPDHGSCFIIKIDVEIIDGADIILNKPKKNVSGLKEGQKKYKILITDDSDDNRELIKSIIKPVGFITEEAVNGVDAIEKINTFMPDVVLLDLRMPAMNGYDTITRLRFLFGNKISIIVVTASAFYEERQKVIDSGADAFLSKPFKENDLFECINSCIGVEYTYK